MVHVYLSRYTPGLKPGQGADIEWQVGERCRYVDRNDVVTDEIVVVASERMSHSAAPEGQYVREVIQEDGARVALSERSLWFAPGVQEQLAAEYASSGL